MRNQLSSNTGNLFRCALVCVFVVGTIQLSAAIPAARHPRRTPQQIEVLLLSSLDPDSPDVAAMVEQAETQILVGSDKPVRFSFDYLDFSSSLADRSHQKATQSYLAE